MAQDPQDRFFRDKDSSTFTSRYFHDVDKVQINAAISNLPVTLVFLGAKRGFFSAVSAGDRRRRI